MEVDYLAMGIDLGTVGVRIALINKNSDLIYSASVSYPSSIEESNDWRNCVEVLINEIPNILKSEIKCCAIDGTSGTLIACNYNGQPMGKAIPYHKIITNQDDKVNKLISSSKNNNLSSLSKALDLIEKYGSNLILRHQADWISSWLTDNWELGEESNNLKLGWDISNKTWPKEFYNKDWSKSLPKVISSGKIIGKVNPNLSRLLDLPNNILVISGTTDSNAAVIAANPSIEEGVTVLGSTIVLKKFINKPLYSDGITNHFLLDKWLCGGSSNTGGRILKKFFSDNEIKELSKQIDPDVETNIKLIPLPEKGERFPVNDPNLMPILEPRPISDSLYLHALLESLAEIESQGWKKLINLGISSPKKIITIGSGAQNIQWRKIRERIIGIPIRQCKKPPAIGAALIALKAVSS